MTNSPSGGGRRFATPTVGIAIAVGLAMENGVPSFGMPVPVGVSMAGATVRAAEVAMRGGAGAGSNVGVGGRGVPSATEVAVAASVAERAAAREDGDATAMSAADVAVVTARVICAEFAGRVAVAPVTVPSVDILAVDIPAGMVAVVTVIAVITVATVAVTVVDAAMPVGTVVFAVDAVVDASPVAGLTGGYKAVRVEAPQPVSKTKTATPVIHRCTCRIHCRRSRLKHSS